MKRILVTGGAGFIGSHVCKALSKGGFLPVTFDNLSHGHEWAVKWGPLVRGNLLSSEELDRAFQQHQPVGVIHLAGSIHLRESIIDPGSHYENNMMGTLSLLKSMIRSSVKTLIYSSSAAVYSATTNAPLSEEDPKTPTSPYGRTKWMAEEMIRDFIDAHDLDCTILRYFNAAGADLDGELGEAHEPETHLIPRLLLNALGQEGEFTLNNDSLPTKDGTAIRDFVHVNDLASGHYLAFLHQLENGGFHTFNLGTGKGFSVKEMIDAVQRITGYTISVTTRSPQVPETAHLVANALQAKKVLDWEPEYSSLETILQSAWKWHLSRTAALL